jgi:hypothetical protein
VNVDRPGANRRGEHLLGVGGRSEHLHAIPGLGSLPITRIGQRAEVDVDEGPDTNHHIEAVLGRQPGDGSGADVVDSVGIGDQPAEYGDQR